MNKTLNVIILYTFIRISNINLCYQNIIRKSRQGIFIKPSLFLFYNFHLFLEVSARENINVKKIFIDLIRCVITTHQYQH